MEKIIKTEEGQDVCGNLAEEDLMATKSDCDIVPSSPSAEDNVIPPSYPASEWTTLFSQILSLKQPFQDSEKTLIKAVRAKK